MASNVPDEPSNGPGEPSNVPGEPKAKGETSLQSKFEAQRNTLEEVVESRFGLLSLLRSSKVLTPTDQEEIEGKYTTKSKNQKLLDLISEKGNYQEFIDALQGSGQTHVVNWINGNGVYEPKFDLDWPLTDKEIDILDCNYNWLGEMLGLKEGLNGTLFSRNVINVRQRDFISSKPTSCEANEAFLKILRQSSLKIYYLTARCLRDSNDGHIATVLENVTATVPIHVTLMGESVVEAEEQILDEVVKLRLEKNASLEEEDVDIFLARLRLRFIAAKKGRSIVLFVSCFNIGEFHCLCTKVDKSEMKKILERLFNLLLQNLQPKVLLVTITESDRDNAEKLFEREFLRDKKYDEHFQRLRSQLKYEEPIEVTTGEAVEESEREELPQESGDPSTSASVEDEPTEVTTGESVKENEDKELQKKSEQYSTSESAEGGSLRQHAQQLLNELKRLFDKSETDKLREELDLLSTSSTSRYERGLFDKSETDKLREGLDLQRRSRYMRGLVDKSETDKLKRGMDLLRTSPYERGYFIWKHYEFFTEHIKTHKTLSKLASLPIQTHRSRELWERYERGSMGAPEIMRDINQDIIDFISDSSDEVYCKFIKCLRGTDQSAVANIFQGKGAAVRMKVILEPMENIADIEKEIVAKLTQLREANSPKSEDLWLLLSQLKIGGMEILSAHYDEGIVAWVCFSRIIRYQLRKLIKDNVLGDLFSALFRCLPVSSVPKISQIMCLPELREIIWGLPFIGFGLRNLCQWSVKTSATVSGLKISGIAMMGNKIIITIQNRSALMVFTIDKEGNAIRERDETFKEIETPMHMASSLNLQCLYITDGSTSNIWKVTFDFEWKVDELILWLPGSLTDQITSLSIGRNDNLLVLKEGKPCRLEIYDKEARKLNQLELPTQIMYPNNAVEASNGDFVISHRSDLTPGGICRINNKGDWISRLDLGIKSGPIKRLSEYQDFLVSLPFERILYLKHLLHFTLDDDDQVYACVEGQGVVLLDSELNIEQTIYVKGLKNPYRIHYLTDKKEFLLVHGTDQDSFSVLSNI